MKILAVIGSPRANGNTYKVVREVHDILSSKDDDINVEYVQLSKANLEACKGCFVCIAKGEDKCPLKDEREELEERIKQADALIFAAPVYTYNIPGVMKNFFDRFAYRCHRPDFYGKKVMVAVTTGAVGAGFVGILMSFMLGNMGFRTCARVGITCPPKHELNEKKSAKEIKKLKGQTEKFYINLVSGKKSKPTLIQRISFKMQKKSFIKAPQELADYKFWQEKGWLKDKKPWA